MQDSDRRPSYIRGMPVLRSRAPLDRSNRCCSGCPPKNVRNSSPWFVTHDEVASTIRTSLMLALLSKKMEGDQPLVPPTRALAIRLAPTRAAAAPASTGATPARPIGFTRCATRHISSCRPRGRFALALWSRGPTLGRALRGFGVSLSPRTPPFLRLFLATLSLILRAVAPRHLFDELIDTGGLCLRNGHDGKQQCQRNASHLSPYSAASVAASPIAINNQRARVQRTRPNLPVGPLRLRERIKNAACRGAASLVRRFIVIE